MSTIRPLQPRFSAIVTGKRRQEIEALVKTHIQDMPLDYCLTYKKKFGWLSSLAQKLEMKQDRLRIRLERTMQHLRDDWAHRSRNNILTVGTLMHYPCSQDPDLRARQLKAMDKEVALENEKKPPFGVSIQKVIRIPETSDLFFLQRKHLTVSPIRR